MAYDLCPEDGFLPGAAMVPVPVGKRIAMPQFSAELKTALGVDAVPVVLVDGGTETGTFYIGPIDAPWPLDPTTVDNVINAHDPVDHPFFTDYQKWLHDIRTKVLTGQTLTTDEAGDVNVSLMAYANGLLPACEVTPTSILLPQPPVRPTDTTIPGVV